jgi:hypothetical protein
MLNAVKKVIKSLKMIKINIKIGEVFCKGLKNISYIVI